MTPSVFRWFYSDPGSTAYVIAERVRLSLWDTGLFALWLDITRSESPYKMIGHYRNDPVDLEWVPGKWLRLRSMSADPSMAGSLAHGLALKPSWRYGDVEGYAVWEWYVSESRERWREISGNPVFQSPERLDHDQDLI